MCTPLRDLLMALVIGTLVSACGGDLTLPHDQSPAALEAVSGDGQEGTVGSRLDDPLVVEVTDASAQPVPGVAVEFRFAEEVPEAVIDPTHAVTDSNGRAEAEVRLGANTGTQTVVAEASATDLVATFDLTAVAPENRKKKGRNGNDDDDDDDDEEDEDD